MNSDPTLIGWYYKRGETRLGPFSAAEIARLLRDGTLRPSEMLVEIAETETNAGPDVHYSYLDAAMVASQAACVCHAGGEG